MLLKLLSSNLSSLSIVDIVARVAAGVKGHCPLVKCRAMKGK